MKRYGLISEVGAEKAQKLIDVILGMEKADLAIVNGTLLNVYTGELLDNHAVTVKGAWIAYVGDQPDENIGPDTQVIDARGKILIPGLIDGHTHLADFQYRPSEFLRYAMVGGTTALITETIEPYPVGGYEGVVDFLEALRDQPIKIYATAPAAASTSSRVHGIPRVILKKLLARDDVIGLGESYWQAVLREPELFFHNYEETLQAGKHLVGHSAGARGRKLMAYLAPGISSCHEPINAEEVIERLRLGIHVMIREGGVRRDLEAIARIRTSGVDLRRLILVTDGVVAKDLLERGYMEDVVQKAIDCGFDPVEAVRMATLNVASYFGLDGIIGGIAPGKYADMVIIPEPDRVEAECVISMGRVIAREGRLLVPPREHTFSHETLNSVHLPRKIQPEDFTIPFTGGAETVKVRVIDQISELVTKEWTAHMPVVNGEIRADTSRDILKVAAVDRRFSPGKTFSGFIRGFKMKTGAIAGSGTWDTANIIVVGENEEEMAHAVNRIRDLKGAVVVYGKGRVLAEIPLPIFGLMSDLDIPDLVRKAFELSKTMRDLGFPFRDPLRTLVTLTGAAIPFLRISEEGLIDIKNGGILDLYEA
ncbi:MAG: adenine deaminase C-terminal domain-containing protein [Pseudomonadota bacterium]